MRLGHSGQRRPWANVVPFDFASLLVPAPASDLMSDRQRVDPAQAGKAGEVVIAGVQRRAVLECQGGEVRIA